MTSVFRPSALFPAAIAAALSAAVPARGGLLYCTLRGERVGIAGHAVTYAVSEVLL